MKYQAECQLNTLSLIVFYITEDIVCKEKKINGSTQELDVKFYFDLKLYKIFYENKVTLFHGYQYFMQPFFIFFYLLYRCTDIQKLARYN